MERKPYRIIRGSLSRRDGPSIAPKDEHGRLIEGARTRRSFVHYMAKTEANPDARDEVELTDEEARAFGLARLTRLVRRNNVTIEEAPSEEVADVSSLSDDDFSANVTALLKEANSITGMAETAEFRRKVERAGVLSQVPKRKADLIAALQSLTN